MQQPVGYPLQRVEQKNQKERWSGGWRLKREMGRLEMRTMKEDEDEAGGYLTYFVTNFHVVFIVLFSGDTETRQLFESLHTEDL